MPISKVTTGSITDSVAIDTDTLVVDGTNNRVGIGTASPATTLTIASEGRLRLYRADNARYGDIYNDNNFLNIETSNDPIKLDGQSYIRFDVAADEKVRIDSSGTLLVGMTSSSVATDGSSFNVGGSYAHHTSNNGVALYLNRRTSDGDILSFRKDNSTVGSIGSRSAGNIYIDSAGESGRLQAAGSDVLGWYTGQFFPASDAGASLGTSGNRFSNLYLSGGVYLGGTGSANYLEDYEEGTWTPSVRGAVLAGTYTTGGAESGTYRKIGNTVYVSLVLNGSVSGDSGAYQITGLPFVPEASKGQLGVIYNDTTTTSGIGLFLSNSRILDEENIFVDNNTFYFTGSYTTS